MAGSACDHLHLIKTLAESRTRRGLSQLLGGLAVTGPLAMVGVTGTAAKKKRKKKKVTLCHRGQTISVAKKAKKKHLKHGDTVGACPATTPPPGLVECRDTRGEAGEITGCQRFAQTFLASRSGQLTQAEVFIGNNPDNFSLTFEIRNVTSAGIPGNTILASIVVTGIPATTGSDVRQVKALFSSPAAISAGQRYALAITAAIEEHYLRALIDVDRCPDGLLYADELATGFEMAWDVTTDLLFSTTIT